MNIELVLRHMIGKRVLVIGDVMLDKAIFYKTLRRCNEFDGSVLQEVDRTFFPGGAANVAMNCRALGAQVTLLGAFGTDLQGQHLFSALRSHLVDVPTVAWPGRRYWGTTTKSRLYVDDKPTQRIDNDVHQDLDLASVLTEMNRPFDALLLSDYQKGMFANKSALIEMVQTFKRLHPQAVIAANPKPVTVCFLPVIDLVSLNDAEFNDCKKILGEDRFGWIVHTLGSAGLDIIHRDGDRGFVGRFVADPDVVGCGDAVFAAVSLALSICPEINLLGKIAIAAGTAKARKTGTRPVSPEDILDVTRKMSD